MLHTFRQITRDELDTVIEWARLEGWNPGLHDADLFWQTDRDGFLALDADGEMIGAGSIVMQGIAQSLPFDDTKVSIATTETFESLVKLDRRCFGFDRSRFLRLWISQSDSRTVQYLHGADCLGFGTIRKCVGGWKIGPLFSENSEIADQIFRALNTVASGQTVFLDVPELNAEAVGLADRYGLKECFGCALMYYGTAPQLPYDQIYGVTTFELG